MVSYRALIRSSLIPLTMTVHLQLRIGQEARPLKLNPRKARLCRVIPVLSLPLSQEESQEGGDEDVLPCIILTFP